jgi:hypothetical protein
VTTTRKVRSRPGITVHGRRSLPGRTTRHGIPITALPATIEDLARDKAIELEPVIRSAERLHGLDRSGLPRTQTFARGQLVRLFLTLCDEEGFEPPETEYRLLGYEIDAAWPGSPRAGSRCGSRTRT